MKLIFIILYRVLCLHSMSFSKITRYSNCDILIGTNDYIYPSTTTEGEIIDLAIQHGCLIIAKNGGGKWYLKGKGRKINDLKKSIDRNLKKRYDPSLERDRKTTKGEKYRDVYILLLEFNL